MITLLFLVRATYMYDVVLTHIPFVVNHTINATPPERLQQPKGGRLCLCLKQTWRYWNTSYPSLLWLCMS